MKEGERTHVRTTRKVGRKKGRKENTIDGSNVWSGKERVTLGCMGGGRPSRAARID
jgi:hypothetical protein